MEKIRKSFDLELMKRRFSTVAQLGLCITGTAFRSAQDLGFSREDIVAAIQALKPSDFYKSMTSYADHRVWQDVYHLNIRVRILYIKFSI